MNASVIETLKTIKNAWPGRSAEAEELVTFLSNGDRLSTLFIFGPACSGKTELTLDVVQSLNMVFSYASLTVNCMSLNDAFLTFASHLASRFDTGTEIKQLARACKNVTHFCDFLELFEKNHSGGMPVVLVIDDVHSPEFNESFPRWFLSFREALRGTHCNVRIICISRVELDVELASTHEIVFREYSEKATLKEVLATHIKPARNEEGAYDRFMQFVLSNFSSRITDLDDWVYLVQQLWAGYKSMNFDANKLQALVAKLHRCAVSRDCESLSTLTARLERFTDPTARVQKRLDSLAERDVVVAAELPYVSKVLLVALFIAGVNPPEYDSVIWGGRKRRKLSRKSKTSGANLASPAYFKPRAFALDRARWIFKALLLDLQGIANSDIVYGIDRYMISLVSLKLVAKVSDDHNLSDVMYKCHASRTFTDAVARILKVDLTKYLADCATT